MSKPKEPRVLIWDIETTPILAEVWRTWNIDRVIRVVKDWEMLSVSWQWFGEKEVHFLARKPKSDRNLCTKLRELWAEADLMVAQNGDKFDIPKTKTRMIYHDRTVPTIPPSFDTKKVASGQFGFTGNGLKDLCNFFGIKQKLDPGGHKTWVGCMEGDKKAWKVMEAYNKRDVEALSALYKILRPWSKSHPRILDSLILCFCGGKLAKWGFRLTKRSKVQRYRCQTCGHRS